MTRRAALFALLCSLVGLGASAAAAYTHYHLLYDPAYRSFCDVNETISCTQVYMSRFSTVRGIPVALFGATAFVAAALLSISGLTARPAVRENVPGYLFVLSTLSLAVILYLGYASFVLLKAVCLLCLTTYAAVIGLFLVSGAATSFPMTTLPRRASSDVRVFARSPLAIVVAILFFAGAASTLAWFPREGGCGAGRSRGPGLAPGSHAGSDVGVPALVQLAAAGAAGRAVRRREGAGREVQRLPVPGLRPVLPAIQADFREVRGGAPRPGEAGAEGLPAQSRLQRRAGADHSPGGLRRGGRGAARGAHNKTEAMEEWLYTHQPAMTPPSVRQAARDIGQIADFDANYQATLALVKGDVALGRQLGIKSTPTFYINGVKVEGALPPQYFDQAIAYELQHASSK